MLEELKEYFVAEMMPVAVLVFMFVMLAIGSYYGIKQAEARRVREAQYWELVAAECRAMGGLPIKEYFDTPRILQCALIEKN